MRSHCGMNPAEINGRKPASCGHALVRLGLASPCADLIDEGQTTQQPAVNRVSKGILRWFCQPPLDVATVRVLRIAAAHISLPGGVYEVVRHPIDSRSPRAIARIARPAPLSRVWHKRALASHGVEVNVAAHTPEIGLVLDQLALAAKTDSTISSSLLRVLAIADLRPPELVHDTVASIPGQRSGRKAARLTKSS